MIGFRVWFAVSSCLGTFYPLRSTVISSGAEPSFLPGIRFPPSLVQARFLEDSRIKTEARESEFSDSKYPPPVRVHFTRAPPSAAWLSIDFYG